MGFTLQLLFLIRPPLAQDWFTADTIQKLKHLSKSSQLLAVDIFLIYIVKEELFGLSLNRGSLKMRWRGVTKTAAANELCRHLSAVFLEV
jgi:hypothetical protein